MQFWTWIWRTVWWWHPSCASFLARRGVAQTSCSSTRSSRSQVLQPCAMRTSLHKGGIAGPGFVSSLDFSGRDQTQIQGNRAALLGCMLTLECGTWKMCHGVRGLRLLHSPSLDTHELKPSLLCVNSLCPWQTKRTLFGRLEAQGLSCHLPADPAAIGIR